MKLSRAAVAFYVGLIFLSGLVLGAFSHRLYTVNERGRFARPNPDEWRKRYMVGNADALETRPGAGRPVEHDSG
jgi:hypothetical protein